MTNKQILKKAIIKAIKNGFRLKEWKENISESKIIKELDVFTKEGILNFVSNGIIIRYTIPIWEFLFSHDFAKAFWGEEMSILKFDTGKEIIGQFSKELPAWQIHLQQMVLEKDPFKYIEKFL